MEVREGHRLDLSRNGLYVSGMECKLDTFDCGTAVWRTEKALVGCFQNG